MQFVQPPQTLVSCRQDQRRPRGPVRAALALLALGVLAPVAARAADVPALLDDFADTALSPAGATRLLIDDSGIGSKSRATQQCADGVIRVQGTLVPGRGVPAFMSLVLPLAVDAHPCDRSAFSGVRLRVKVLSGILSVQAASAEVDNFDFHASPITAKAGEFQEVRLAFTDMRRAWSEQTPLNPRTITSVNIVAFGMTAGDFSYELDEVGFY